MVSLTYFRQCTGYAVRFLTIFAQKSLLPDVVMRSLRSLGFIEAIFNRFYLVSHNFSGKSYRFSRRRVKVNRALHLHSRKQPRSRKTCMRCTSRSLEPLKCKCIFAFFEVIYVRILKIFVPKFLKKFVFSDCGKTFIKFLIFLLSVFNYGDCVFEIHIATMI